MKTKTDSKQTPVPRDIEHREKCGPECTGQCPLRAQIYDKHHTPTPWAVLVPGSGNIWSETAKRYIVLPSPQNRKNMDVDAAFIVRAVNSHEALISACKKAREALDGFRGFSYCNQLDEAIAQAEGGK